MNPTPKLAAPPAEISLMLFFSDVAWPRYDANTELEDMAGPGWFFTGDTAHESYEGVNLGDVGPFATPGVALDAANAWATARGYALCLEAHAVRGRRLPPRP